MTSYKDFQTLLTFVVFFWILGYHVVSNIVEGQDEVSYPDPKEYLRFILRDMIPGQLICTCAGGIISGLLTLALPFILRKIGFRASTQNNTFASRVSTLIGNTEYGRHLIDLLQATALKGMDVKGIVVISSILTFGIIFGICRLSCDTVC